MICSTVAQQALRPPNCDTHGYSESLIDRDTNAEILFGHLLMTSPPMMIDF